MTALTKLLTSTPVRLAVVYMGVFVLATAAVTGYLVWHTNQYLTSRAAAALKVEEASLRGQFSAGGMLGLVAAVDARVNSPGSDLYLLLDGYGNRLAGNLQRRPEALAELGRSSVFFYEPFSEPGVERLAIGTAFAVPDGLVLIVARDIEDQRQLASGIGRMAFVSFGLLSALAVGAGILIGRSMLARIEELLAALREVSDNIAHDLKTPLNRLRNRAEAALRSSDPAAYREGLALTIEEADELIQTFNSLLLIARLEAGAAAETMVPVDLAGVVGDIAELYEPAAEEAGLKLAVVAEPREPKLCAIANRELVSQAVANLVDNAIKYSAVALAPAGGVQTRGAAHAPEIRITLSRIGDAIEIAVGDRGPGIAAQDRERALQRFVRLEKSRSRPGAGLGLSLVAAVARMHGGSVRLEDNRPGLRAVLSIPVRAVA